MAFKAGTTSFLLIDNPAGSPVNISAYVDSIDWPQSTETLDVSTFGTAAKQFIPGLTDGDTIQISGPMDVALATLITSIKAAQSAGSSTCTATWGPGGSVSGQFKVSAETYVTSFGPSSGVGGRAEFSCSLQVTGATTNSTW